MVIALKQRKYYYYGQIGEIADGPGVILGGQLPIFYAWFWRSVEEYYSHELYFFIIRLSISHHRYSVLQKSDQIGNFYQPLYGSI